MFTKPAIVQRSKPNGHHPLPELSISSRGVKNPVKEFLAAKSTWLSRTRRLWLVRAGVYAPEELGASSIPVARNGE